jgi:hypothetical protein
MFKNSKLLLITFLFLLSVFKTNANTGANFLDFGAGARTMGMGRSGIGLSDDASAPYYNPAGLSQIKPQELLFMHSTLFMGTNFEYFAYALPTAKSGSFAFSFVQARIGGIEGRDEYNSLLDEFGESETAGILSYSIDFSSLLSFGINFKILQHSISHWSSLGQDVDIGFMFLPEEPFSLGLTLKNLLKPSFTLISENEQLPIRFDAGASWKTLEDKLILAGDIGWHENSKIQMNGGIEYKLNDLAILRVGADQNYFSYGLGLNFPIGNKSLRIDYAFQDHHQSEGVITPAHNFSLTFNFGGFKAKLYPDKKVFSPITDGENNILWLNKEVRTKGEIEKWKVVIKNRWGEIIRHYEGWGELPQRFYWDGRDDSGQLVHYGDYFYKFVVTEISGIEYISSGKLATIKTESPAERFLIEEKWKGLEEDIYIDEDFESDLEPDTEPEEKPSKQKNLNNQEEE